MAEAHAPENDYVRRVNLAIDHILANLDQPLRLETVAQVAHFSPFHFHRVFRSIVGEPLQQFVRRLRLERAVKLMSYEPRRSLTDVALECGFASASDFSRAFKQRFEVPPSAFDIEAHRESGRARLQATTTAFGTDHRIDRLPAGENPDGFQVAMKDLPARTVAYVRVMKSYEGGGEGVVGAVERLLRWAEKRGLADRQWLGYMWDDPEIVAMEDCRYDVGLEVDHVEPEGVIGRFEFPAMKVAEVEIRGGIELEMRAIDWMFRTWLPRSGYVPTDQPSFEVWIGRPFAHGMEHFELRMHLPVRKP